MREPDSILDGLRQPDWDLASPAQVRRRGDQLTQRRARAATAGLVAVVAIPVAVATMIGTRASAGQTVTATPSVRPSETTSAPSWLTSVPATFDLSRGLRGTTLPAPPADDLMARVTICGRARWVAGVPGDAVDTQAIVSSEPAGADVERLLVLYPDDVAARSALDGLRRLGASCAGTDAGDLGLGDGVESWGSDSLLAVRVGNAILVDRSPGSSPSDVSGVDRLSVRAVDVVREMCVFAADQC